MLELNLKAFHKMTVNCLMSVWLIALLHKNLQSDLVWEAFPWMLSTGNTYATPFEKNLETSLHL